MAGETRRKFDHDFREGAVRLVRETRKPIAQVARDVQTDLEADREVANTLADLIIGGLLVADVDDQADAPDRANET